MTIQLSSETERLARLLVIKTGKDLDDVVKEAIEERARAAGVPVGASRRTPEAIERSLNEIVTRDCALPVLDNRSADEIIGYDEFGVPRLLSSMHRKLFSVSGHHTSVDLRTEQMFNSSD